MLTIPSLSLSFALCKVCDKTSFQTDQPPDAYWSFSAGVEVDSSVLLPGCQRHIVAIGICGMPPCSLMIVVRGWRKKVKFVILVLLDVG